jgi:hypothetical protein
MKGRQQNNEVLKKTITVSVMLPLTAAKGRKRNNTAATCSRAISISDVRNTPSNECFLTQQENKKKADTTQQHSTHRHNLLALIAVKSSREMR